MFDAIRYVPSGTHAKRNRRVTQRSRGAAPVTIPSDKCVARSIAVHVPSGDGILLVRSMRVGRVERERSYVTPQEPPPSEWGFDYLRDDEDDECRTLTPYCVQETDWVARLRPRLGTDGSDVLLIYVRHDRRAALRAGLRLRSRRH